MTHASSPRRDRNTAYGVASPERDRLPTEFRTLSSLLTGLTAFWTFDTLQDSVSGTSLINPSGVDFSTEPGSAILNGNNYLEAPNSSALQAGDIDFTIAIRVYLVNLNFYGILNKWSSVSTNSEYEIISNSNISFFVTNAGETDYQSAIVSAGVVALPGWNTIIAEHDSVNNQLRLTCNSAPTVVSSWSQGIRVSDNNLTFGAYSGNQLNKAPSGTRFDYAGTWKRLLTDEEKSQVSLEYPF